MMRSFRPRSSRPAIIGVALGLLLASCIGAGTSDDDAADVEPTRPTDSTGPVDAETTTTTAAEADVPGAGDLTDVAWVVNDFDGLVDDQGRVLVPAPEGVFEERRPSIVRATDGSIHFVFDDRLWRWEIDADEPEEMDGDPDEISERSRIDGADGPDDGDVITATNGITVRILPPDVDVDDRGYVTKLRSPARLQVERDGVTEWTVDAGGVRSPWLNLVDFDGRFVMMARSPTEPADPMLQHLVYDLDCPTDAAAGEGCTRTFQARWGTASLVGPDLPADEDDLNTVLLDICPTQRVEIAPPAEMTDPDSFDEDFTDDDLAAFQSVALQLTTCDPSALGDPQQAGLAYVPGSDDPDESGWMWTALARSLRGPFVDRQDGTWIWASHENGPNAVLDRGFSPSRFDLRPGRRYPDALAITITSGSVLVSGRTDPATAGAITDSAQALADERGVQLSDWIDTTGAAHPAGLVEDFVTAINDDLSNDSIGEMHLTVDGVIRNLRDQSEPTAAERDLGFLVADFASGGEGIYDELPLADDVLMALGSEVVARRQPSELFRRSAWVVDSADFAGRVGPFNVLNLVPSPTEIVVGPHARCAGPEAVPSPPELATYTRIGILPLEGSIDSCLDWSAVNLFVDDDGMIQGVSLQLSEP